MHSLKPQWDSMSKASTGEDDSSRVLCELHFDKNCFLLDSEGKKQLKPNSIPTKDTGKFSIYLLSIKIHKTNLIFRSEASSSKNRDDPVTS